MSTTLHVVFIVICSNVYFVVVIFTIYGQKCNFLEAVKIPYPKNRFLVILRSLLSTDKFFPGQGWLFPVSTSKENYFNEKMSSLAGLKKSFSISYKSTDFG